jgi:hypothetical protein
MTAFVNFGGSQKAKTFFPFCRSILETGEIMLRFGSAGFQSRRESLPAGI